MLAVLLCHTSSILSVAFHPLLSLSEGDCARYLRQIALIARPGSSPQQSSVFLSGSQRGKFQTCDLYKDRSPIPWPAGLSLCFRIPEGESCQGAWLVSLSGDLFFSTQLLEGHFRKQCLWLIRGLTHHHSVHSVSQNTRGFSQMDFQGLWRRQTKLFWTFRKPMPCTALRSISQTPGAPSVLVAVWESYLYISCILKFSHSYITGIQVRFIHFEWGFLYSPGWPPS